MMIRNKQQEQHLPFIIAVQAACLLIMGIVEFLNMTKGFLLPVNLPLLTNGGIVLSLMGLWAVTLWKNNRAVLQRDVILGILLFAWFLVLELNRRFNHTPLQSFTVVAAVYLIALPFAALAQDRDRRMGLRLISGIYVAAALLLLSLGLILLLGGNIPAPLNGHVYWDGPRLLVISHPNITSRIFMIALALCMGFCGQAKQTWTKVLMLLAAALLFAGIALTNCRAVVLVSCCILGGNVFSLISRKNRKYILLGVVAAMVVAYLLFLSSSCLYQWNYSRLVNQASQHTAQEAALPEDSGLDVTVASDAVAPADETQETELAGNSNSGQGTILSDLPTLNNRTYIWASFIKKIQQEPAILLRGTVDTRLVLGNLHTHNAWLEALIMLGLPGFLLILFFSWDTAWSSLRLILHNGADMFQKNIALLSLSTMVAALLEPCLFITYLEWSFSDFFFFLCLGYLTLWSKQISFKK